MAKFLSEKWLKECRKTLQDSDEFQSEARDFSGDFIFSFEADDETEDAFSELETSALDSL